MIYDLEHAKIDIFPKMLVTGCGQGRKPQPN